MADGRMIRKRISQSKKLASCNTDSARLLYFMMYPHADVEGRLNADTRLIKGQIIPLFEWSCGKIRLCLENLNEVGLIVLYNIEGDDYLEFTRFGDFQTLRKDHEAKSEIPPPPAQLRTKAVVLPLKLSQVKLIQDKISASAPSTTDLEFIKSLNANEAYKHINVNIELAKMDAWLSTHKGRQKTRRFIVNWLNKIEAPIQPQPKPKPEPPLPKERFIQPSAEDRAKLKALVGGIGNTK